MLALILNAQNELPVFEIIFIIVIVGEVPVEKVVMNEDAAQLRESLATYQVQLQQVSHDTGLVVDANHFDGHYLESL